MKIRKICERRSRSRKYAEFGPVSRCCYPEDGKETCNTLNANMADHSVGARDEWNESEATQALMFVCFDNAFLDREVLLRCRFFPFVLSSLRVFVFRNATAIEWNLPQQRKLV